MGSGVGQGDGGGGGDGDDGGGASWAHAPKAASALAKTADIKEFLFMVRKLAACQHPVSYATGERMPLPRRGATGLARSSLAQPEQPLSGGDQGLRSLGEVEANVLVHRFAKEAGSRHSGNPHVRG